MHLHYIAPLTQTAKKQAQEGVCPIGYVRFCDVEFGTDERPSHEYYEAFELPDDLAETYYLLLYHPDAYLTGAWREFIERVLDHGYTELDAGSMEYLHREFLLPLGLHDAMWRRLPDQAPIPF